MDPNACLARVLEAVRTRDSDELRTAANDLADWLDKGGFQPIALPIDAALVILDHARRYPE
jgi:hypothetical protein